MKSALAFAILCQGPTVQTTLISHTEAFSSNQCFVSQPLALQHGYQDFSFGTYAVDYWVGAFQRPVEVTEIYEHDIYDCLGDLQNTGYEMVKYSEQRVVNIENSNLGGDVGSWIEASAPMTDAESQKAFAHALQNCLGMEL